MSYDRVGLYELVRKRLESAPGTHLMDLASELNVSRHTIERSVRAVSGQSFFELKQQTLLRKSTEALTSQPNLSIKELACRFGYEDARSFSRFVRAATRHSPTELRSLSHVVEDIRESGAA